MSFPTPAQAELVTNLTPAQLEIFKNSFGINDDPLRIDRTYVIFDADAGNNNFHIDTGASLSYSIIQGDGSQEISYTDTGGTKILNFDTAGRYLITIKETFQGISTDGASAPDKAKYIAIIAGSNYPTTIATLSFKSCNKLESILFPNVLIVDIKAFEGCLLLKEIFLPIATDIKEYAFNGLSVLEFLNLPKVTDIDSYAFDNNIKLKEVILPLVTTINVGAFRNSVIREVEILYSGGLAFGSNVFDSVIIDSLFVLGSTLVQAQGVRNKFVTAGCAVSSEFQLISDDIEPNSLSLNERIEANSDSISDSINTIITDYLGGLKTKIVNIGIWNMDANTGVGVAHGLGDATKIRGVQAFILRDSPTIGIRIVNLQTVDSASGVTNGGINTIGDTNINLIRLVGGAFDNADYDDAVINRGYLKIDYDAS